MSQHKKNRYYIHSQLNKPSRVIPCRVDSVKRDGQPVHQKEPRPGTSKICLTDTTPHFFKTNVSPRNPNTDRIASGINKQLASAEYLLCFFHYVY